MTKRTLVICCVALLITLCGCGDAKIPAPSNQEDSMEKGGQVSVKYTNPKECIWEKDENEIKEVIQSCSNFTLAEDFWMGMIPESATLYDYVRYDDASKALYFDEYVKQFTGIFQFFFPGRKMREDSLYYGGFGSGEPDENGVRSYRLLEGYEEKIRNAQEEAGKPGHVWLIYDENMNGQMTEWDSPICMKLGVAFGYGYGEIDRGNILKRIGKNPETGTYQALHSYEPEELFPLVGIYTPDSEECFSLHGKQVKICDAVSFFEQYINQVPYPEDANERTRVVEVRVLQVSDSEYGYELFLTAEYEGLLQDYGWNMISSDTGRMSRRYGRALLLDGNEVEWIENYFRKSDIREQSEINRMITMDSAVRIISRELSENVIFQAKSLELVYFMEYIPTEKGYVDIENGSPHKVWPRWKLTLRNPNDNTEYICYVDAEDGKNFWYYKQYLLED
ncbi:MAG: hypothetical protein ACI4E2_04460 [Acetatifactor sp.]